MAIGEPEPFKHIWSNKVSDTSTGHGDASRLLLILGGKLFWRDFFLVPKYDRPRMYVPTLWLKYTPYTWWSVSSVDDMFVLDGEYDSFTQIREAFLAAVALGPCLLIIDGLDEISTCMGQTITEVSGVKSESMFKIFRNSGGGVPKDSWAGGRWEINIPSIQHIFRERLMSHLCTLPHACLSSFYEAMSSEWHYSLYPRCSRPVFSWYKETVGLPWLRV